MSFDISQTPTLQAVATADESRLAADLRARTEAALQQAAEHDDVRRAAEAHQAAEARLTRLRKAERALSRYAREIDGRAKTHRQAALDEFIERAAEGAKPEFKALTEAGIWEARGRCTSGAIERLVETLLPVAELDALREEAHLMSAKSRALERTAQERAEKILGQMREAVSEEMVLPVDMSKGVSGALLAHAAEFQRRAIQISENADRLEKKHGLGR